MAFACNPYCMQEMDGQLQLLSCDSMAPDLRGQFRFNVQPYNPPRGQKARNIRAAGEQPPAAQVIPPADEDETDTDDEDFADLINIAEEEEEEEEEDEPYTDHRYRGGCSFKKGRKKHSCLAVCTTGTNERIKPVGYKEECYEHPKRNIFVCKKTYTDAEGVETVIYLEHEKPKLISVQTEKVPVAGKKKKTTASGSGNAMAKRKKKLNCTYQQGNYLTCNPIDTPDAGLQHCYVRPDGTIQCLDTPLEMPGPLVVVPGPAMMAPGPAMMAPGPAVVTPGPAMVAPGPFDPYSCPKYEIFTRLIPMQ